MKNTFIATTVILAYLVIMGASLITLIHNIIIPM